MAATVPTTAPSEPFVAFSPRSTSSLPSDRSAFVFVWGIWALAMLAGLAFVGTYGIRNVPFNDDWHGVIPLVTGETPITIATLWAQISEHRLPLPRLLLVALYKLTGFDFRAGMFFNVLALGALAFAMIGVATRIRGHASYADAFFPLALLHWGHYENLLWSYQVQFVLSTALACALLLVIVLWGARLPPRAALLAGICFVLLPLCGANGLVFVPPLGLWLGYVGVLRWRSAEPEAKQVGGLLLGFAFAGFVLVGLYFQGYVKDSALNPGFAGVRAVIRTALQFLSLSIGPAGVFFWPYSGLMVFGLLLLCAVVVAVVWLQQPPERLRALGLLLFLVAIAGLCLGVGWGRAGLGNQAGFILRYVTIAVPALCLVYFVVGMYGPSLSRSLSQMCLFALMCFLGSSYVKPSVEFGSFWRGRAEAFERDLKAGLPPFLLAERHDHGFETPIPDFIKRLPMLRRAGIGQFRHLREDPAFRQVTLPVEPAATNRLTWDRSTGQGSGKNAYLLFRLKKPQLVYAVRVKYAYTSTVSPALFQMFWSRRGRNDFSQTARATSLSLEAGPEKTTTFWVNDTVDQFRIHPNDKPFVFRISQITLLVPPRESQALLKGSRTGTSNL